MDFQLRKGKRHFNKIFWTNFLLPPFVCISLNYVIPGGLLKAHNTVILVSSVICCLFHFYTTSQKMFTLLSGCLLSMATFMIIPLLFGAKLQNWSENLTWSVLMTTLVSLPVLQLPTEDSEHPWQRIFLGLKTRSELEHQTFLISLATIAGTWIGACPILLDWNTAWQVWPLPCSVGALIGNMCGYILSLSLSTRHFSLL